MKYKLQAKRPHELVFTNWCSTDDYEAVKRNIAVIEGYGWQWQLEEGEFEDTEREQERYEQLQIIAESMRLLGERIKKAREAKGLEQKELAEKIRITPSSMCLFEKGKRNISKEMLYVIADALGVNIYELEGRNNR
jgi:ribosome-binding protein aMBF1 (putative translation factor)